MKKDPWRKKPWLRRPSSPWWLSLVLVLAVLGGACGFRDPGRAIKTVAQTVFYRAPDLAYRYSVCKAPGMIPGVGLGMVVSLLGGDSVCGDDKITVGLPLGDKSILSAIPKMGAGAQVDMELTGPTRVAEPVPGLVIDGAEVATVTAAVRQVYSVKVHKEANVKKERR